MPFRGLDSRKASLRVKSRLQCRTYITPSLNRNIKERSRTTPSADLIELRPGLLPTNDIKTHHPNRWPNRRHDRRHNLRPIGTPTSTPTQQTRTRRHPNPRWMDRIRGAEADGLGTDRPRPAAAGASGRGDAIALESRPVFPGEAWGVIRWMRG